MPPPKNNIHRLIAEVQVPASGDGIVAQNEASWFMRERIIPIIERVTDRIDTGNSLIRIDKLELDFGTYYPGRTNDEALKEFEFLVEQELIRVISKTKSDKIETPVKKLSESDELEEQFFYLLEEGVLPWWNRAAMSTVTLQALAEKLLIKIQPKFIERLRLALKNKAARQRVAHKLNVNQIQQLLVLVNNQAEKQIKIIDSIKAFFNAQTTVTATQRHLAEKFIYQHALLPSLVSITVQDFLMELLQQENNNLPPQVELLMNKALDYFTKKAASPQTKETNENDTTEQETIENETTPKKSKEQNDQNDDEENTLNNNQNLAPDKNVTESKKEKLETEITANKKRKELEDAKKEAIEKKQIKEGTIIPDQIETTATSDTENSEKTKTISAEDFLKQILAKEQAMVANQTKDSEFPVSEIKSDKYFIQNAGVIILAPFLPLLFKELELVKNNTFLSDEAKERAICLIHYMLNNTQENFEEHEMTLNKILCGFPIFNPLIYTITITDKEKEECNNVLASVVEHWKALKNTSPESMRQAFFVRDGLIERQTNGWNLKIERTTIDILLDKLPWGISIIKLPWSEETIFVDWT